MALLLGIFFLRGVPEDVVVVIEEGEKGGRSVWHYFAAAFVWTDFIFQEEMLLTVTSPPLLNRLT